MPWSPKKPCNHPGCGALVSGRYCDQHAKQYGWNQHTTTMQERGYPRTWKQIRAIVLAEEPLCAYCQRAASTEVDHIVPISEGGSHDRSNLTGCCHRCHANKTALEAARSRRRAHG